MLEKKAQADSLANLASPRGISEVKFVPVGFQQNSSIEFEKKVSSNEVLVLTRLQVQQPQDNKENS